jgi:ATP-binding cassette subfamily D (ALD) long-chain fatty acid import protein
MGDNSDDWEFQRIGTESEKSSVEKELAELRERLAKVEEWKNRKAEIEEELGRVWVQGEGEEGEVLAPPPYLESEEEALESSESVGADDEAVESESQSPASDEQAVESDASVLASEQ